MNDLINRQDALDALKANAEKSENPAVVAGIVMSMNDIRLLPSAEPKWNNHTVACLLAEMFGDTCACNYSGIDEWLPEKCEVIDSCPKPVGVACWEQFLTHRVERRTDE